MSLNLWCKEVPLVQTPTVITLLCFFSKYNAKNHKKCKKGDWRSILDKYLLWYKDRLLGGGMPEEDYEYAMSLYSAHERELRRAVRIHKKLTFKIS